MIKLVIINDSNIAKLLLSVITNNRFFTHLGPTWGKKMNIHATPLTQQNE